jgi:hypothetical protein
LLQEKRVCVAQDLAAEAWAEAKAVPVGRSSPETTYSARAAASSRSMAACTSATVT